MTPADAGTAYVQIRGDMSHLNKALVANLHPTRLGGLGKKGGFALGAGIAAAVGAGAAGKALFGLGERFDDQFDKIRVGTGKTGESLNALEGDFKGVAKSVPDSFEDTGTAISELNRRLGLTGKPLRAMATQMLQLSRITGTDLSSNIESVARAFEDWDVPIKDQSKALDGLFRLGQRSGISVDKLADSVQKFGSPLRILGFSLGEAAATFATFERAGVNTQTMVPGLKLAIANLIKPSKDLETSMKELGISAGKPEEGLKKVFALLGNKSNLTNAEKTSLAMEVFGKRAGADMAEAVRQGRFEVDAMLKTFGKGDSIDKAARQTEDFAESWQRLKNRVFIGIEPVATKFFNAISDGMEALSTADFSQIGQDIGFGEIDTGELGASVQNVKSIIRDLGPAFDFIGDVGKRQIAALAQVFRGMAQTIKGVTQIISGILSGDFGKAWAGVKNVFGGGVKLAVGQMRFMTAPVREAAARVGQVLASAFRAAWDRVKAIFTGGVRGAAAALRGMASSLGDIASRAGVALASPFRGAWARVREIFSAGARVAGGALRGFGNTIGRLTSGPVRLLTTGFGKIAAVLRTLVEWARRAASALSKIKPPSLPGVGGLLDKINPFAKGGVVKYSLALVGEEGPELAKLPGGKQTIVGQQGPEITHLPVNTRVFSHTETKRKLKSVVEKVTRVLPGDGALAAAVGEVAGVDRSAKADKPGSTPGAAASVPKGLPAGPIRKGLERLTIGQIEAPALTKGGIVPPASLLKTADPSLQVIRASDGKHVAVRQEGNLPPQIIRVADSLRTLVDKPAEARVSELSTVRDRTVRSLVTEAVRRSDTKRESTSHSSSRQSSVLQRVVKQLGIQAFARGGMVRKDSRLVERDLRERLGPERFERLRVASILKQASAERVERLVERLGPERFSNLVEREGADRVVKQVSQERSKASRLVERFSKSDVVRQALGAVRLALVGERGYELAKLPGGTTTVVGSAGPEVHALPVGTRVYPHRDARTQEVAESVPFLPVSLPPIVTQGLQQVRQQMGVPAFARGGIVKREDEDRDPTARGKGQPDRGARGSGGKVPYEDKRTLRGATASVSSGIPTRANKLDRLKLPYKWGGGHGNIGQALKSGFDCSGAVSYVLGIPARVSGQFSGWGKPGPGEVATYSNTKHVVMSVGSRLFGTGDDTGPHWLSGGPGPRFSAPFATRHIGKAGTREGFDTPGKDAPAKPKRITGGSLSLGQMVTLAKQAGFPDPALAAAVGYAESRGKVGAIGDGGDSIGLWQINMPAHPRYKEDDLKDARKNARAAVQISGGGKNWKPWTQFRTGAYKQFLGGKATPLPGGKGGGGPASSSQADYLAWKLQEAEATEGTTKDDLRWINRGLRYWRKVLTRSKRAGNAKRSSEALSQITSLREKKVGLRDVVDEDAFTLDEVSSLNAGTVKWNIAGLQPQLDRLDLDIGKAALTENLDAAGNVTPDSYGDDIAAATGLRDFWQNVYDLTIGKLDLGMQVKAVQGDPSKVKRLADGRFSTKVGNRTYTFSATPGDTITVGGKKVTVPGGPQLEKRPGTVLGTGKQQLEAATSLKSARDSLRSIQDEMKSEAVSPADAETKPDFAEELKKFLAAFARIGPEFGPNFKSLPRFAKGGVSRLGLALVGEQGFELAEKGRQIAAVGIGGPEIRELPVGTRVHPHDKSKRMAREMGIPGFQSGGIVAPVQPVQAARDESLARAVERLEAALRQMKPGVTVGEQNLHFSTPPEEQQSVQKNALQELENAL